MSCGQQPACKMAFGVKTGNIYDLLEDNDTENVEPAKPEPKAAPAKEKEATKQGEPGEGCK